MNKNENSFQCKLVEDDSLSNIYKLRHEVYVQEKSYIEAGNRIAQNQMVKEAADKQSYQFGVYFNNLLVATARYNKSSDVEAINFFCDYKQYLLDICKSDQAKIIEISRIAVKQEFRGSYAIILLFFTMIHHAIVESKADILAFKIRETEKMLEKFYINFGCTIIKESRKKINIYDNDNGEYFYFGYLNLHDILNNSVADKMNKIFSRIDKQYYNEKMQEIVDMLEVLHSHEALR